MLALIPFPPVDPVAFQLGPMQIRWYGVAYVLGFIATDLILCRNRKPGRLGISGSQLIEVFAWTAAGVIVGGRLGWWLFYHPSSGSNEPWYEVFAIWNGGMSFHGGLIGVCLGIAAWCWTNGGSFLRLADSLSLVAPVGLFLGRLASFVNAELVGRSTNLPWGVLFPGDTIARHPSQLYEAILEGPVLMMILVMVQRRWPNSVGFVSGAFAFGSGILRILVEFAREPDGQLGFVALGWLTMGQILGAGTAVAGVLLWAVAIRISSPEGRRTTAADSAPSNVAQA